MNAVTKRMVKTAIDANEIADESLRDLESQNEIIKKQQDEVALMGDQINIADRKIKGIRSFFSHLGNQFKKDNSGEHQKARQKYEKEHAKESFKIEAEKQKMDERDLNAKIELNTLELKLAAEGDAEQLRQAKVQSHQEMKAIKRGGNTGENTVFLGKFMFEENEVPGQQCEAEDNLDEVGKQVKMMKTKAESMSDYVVESHRRIGDLHTELDQVQQRTVIATKKEEKILKPSFF